jgi:hypothetical protein
MYDTSIPKTRFHSKYNIFCKLEWYLDRKCFQTKFPELLYPNVPTAGIYEGKKKFKN